MQIVILAAGKGTRMKDLTDEVPKPLLKYKGVSLLEHKLQVLPSNTTNIVIVIGYLGDQIRHAFGDSYKNIPITYIEQMDMKGTADALWQCKHVLHESFMVLMGDDIYSKDDLDKLANIEAQQWAVLAYLDKPGIKAGKIVKNKDGNLREIYEDFDGTSQYNLLYTGVCVLTPEVFTKPMFQLSNGEFGLPQSFAQFTDQKDIQVFETEEWLRITAPEDLE